MRSKHRKDRPRSLIMRRLMPTAKTTMLPAYTPTRTKGLQYDPQLDDRLLRHCRQSAAAVRAKRQFSSRAIIAQMMRAILLAKATVAPSEACEP